MRLLKRQANPQPPRMFPDLKTDQARSHLRLELDGRSATVQVEAFLQGYDSPDFVAFPKQVEWDDGSPISDEDRKRILQTLLASAEERGLTVTVE